MEQTVVILPSAAAAETFVDDTEQAWNECTSVALSVSDGQQWHDWELRDAVRDGVIVSQPSNWAGSTSWACQHSMGAVSNAIVEVSVCGERGGDDAKSLVTEMIGMAAQR